MDHVNAEVRSRKGPIVMREMLDPIEIGVVLLPLDRPAARIIIEEGDTGFGPRLGQQFTHSQHVRAEQLDLIIERPRLTRLIDQAAVILLLPIQRGPPLPVEHAVRAVADGLPRHAFFAVVRAGQHEDMAAEWLVRLGDDRLAG